MIFKNYSEIENSYRQKYLHYILDQGKSGGDDWLVFEKIHGSNFQMACDGTEVKAGKRTMFLDDTDNFFNWETVYDKYSKAVIAIYNVIQDVNTDLVQITVFGELYGGKYNHPDIKPVQNASKVQKEVNYCPHNDLMVFDIYMYSGEEDQTGEWLNYTVVKNFCNTHGLMCLEPLFRGELDDCLRYPNAFESTIPAYHGLPIIENNICEGVVIKPETPRHLFNGARIIIKNKNDKFSETSHQPKTLPHPAELTGICADHFAAMSLMVTENRLKNVLSKMGPVTDKQFGSLMSAFMSDVMKDYLKDNKEEYDKLGKAEQKQISKKVTGLIVQLIRPNFINIIDGIY